MKLRFVVEDQSGKEMLKVLIPKIIGEEYDVTFHHYKGIGHLPRNLSTAASIKNAHLLNDLPRLLCAYGKTDEFSIVPVNIIIICDLDRNDFQTFSDNLNKLLSSCPYHLSAYFCIAIEEGEAWFLGDIPAIKKAYPQAKEAILNAYINDSICDTWEMLASAIVSGGSNTLKNRSGNAVGKEKCIWAKKISPHMNINENKSPSFCFFRNCLMDIVAENKE